ncbi:hypothetical protein K466DRAFT_150091 [Polyporus arcularius HHB13444]|uniref:Uncharacterized protein n=1 Tax=Polyporus arcularius HHB13444 TaxID=1314778 RepID=A0A5C3NN16_9APHY|nr:hypothetical protein K466DRAFT_150091 [Polyporus arcularius HHB13444]
MTTVLAPERFPVAGVRYKAIRMPLKFRPDTTSNRFPRDAYLAVSKSAQDSLVSRSHRFQTSSPSPSRTKITAFGEDYQQPAAPLRCAQSRRIPEWLVANRFSHRQVIHILQHRRHKSHKDCVRLS